MPPPCGRGVEGGGWRVEGGGDASTSLYPGRCPVLSAFWPFLRPFGSKRQSRAQAVFAELAELEFGFLKDCSAVDNTGNV